MGSNYVALTMESHDVDTHHGNMMYALTMWSNYVALTMGSHDVALTMGSHDVRTH